jgi:hypothetical protein
LLLDTPIGISSTHFGGVVRTSPDITMLLIPVRDGGNQKVVLFRGSEDNRPART